ARVTPGFSLDTARRVDNPGARMTSERVSRRGTIALGGTSPDQMSAGAIAASAGLSQHDRLRLGARQGAPGFDLGRDLADGREKFLLVVIALPPPAAVELDEMRATALGQPTPPPGDLARIPNFDFSGHDTATKPRMNDDA